MKLEETDFAKIIREKTFSTKKPHKPTEEEIKRRQEEWKEYYRNNPEKGA